MRERDVRVHRCEGVSVCVSSSHQLTEVYIVKVSVEFCSVTSFQSRAQTKVTQLYVTLEWVNGNGLIRMGEWEWVNHNMKWVNWNMESENERGESEWKNGNG